MNNYWGIRDASVKFCEEPYVHSNYIAEYYNTLSGISYILIALPYVKSNIQTIAIPSICLGIGTIFLHMTQRYYGQIMDELAMLTVCYLILNKLNKNKYPKKILPFLMLIYIQNYENFLVFFTKFVGLMVLLVYESYHIKIKNKIHRRVFLICMFIGGLCWGLDQMLCEYVQNLHLHSIWHILTAISLHSGFRIIKNQ